MNTANEELEDASQGETHDYENECEDDDDDDDESMDSAREELDYSSPEEACDGHEDSDSGGG
jgi:hypothetical protein